MQLESAKRYGSWTGAEIEKFLIQAKMPMRVSVTSRQGPLIVPLWYQYDAGRLWSCSPSKSLVVQAFTRSPEVAFDISTNDIPYKGVRGRCRAECQEIESKEQLTELLEKYLGGTQNKLARWLLSRDVDESLVQLDISWLTSWDFSARMADLDKLASRQPDLDL